MDPNAALAAILDPVTDIDRAAECAEALKNWLASGGFVPAAAENVYGPGAHDNDVNCWDYWLAVLSWWHTCTDDPRTDNPESMAHHRGAAVRAREELAYLLGYDTPRFAGGAS